MNYVFPYIRKRPKFNQLNNGISFLGQIIKPYRTYAKTRTINSLKNTMYGIMNRPDLTISDVDLARINSYLGFLQHVNEKKITRQIITKSGINNLLSFKEDLSKIVKK